MSTLSSQPSQSNSHWLLTSLGVRLSDVTYSLDGQSTSSKLSPVALLKLLADEKRPQQVLALVTREAEKEPLAYLKDEAGCPVTPVSIPDGKSPAEIWEILSRILAAVPPGIRLTLDVTHAFRSLPFVYLTATLFLSSLRDVTIEGVYYGMLEARGEGDAKPLVDLSIVLRLAEWFYATRTFRETGQAHGLIHLFGDGSTTGDVRPGFVTALAEFSRSYASGLPLEVGQAAAAICRQGREGSGSFLHVPAGEELLQSIVQAAEPFELVDADGNPYSSKREVILDLEELKRQARLIDLYLQREQFAAAIQSIREWMVNRVLLAEARAATGEGAGWLEYRPVRERAEQKLNILKFIPRNMLTAQQRQTNAWWQRLGNARNEVAHCGFRANRVEVPKQLEEVRQVWEQVRAQLEDESFWRLKVREGDGVLLVSPVGWSRGALFTALKKVQARWLLPIASQDTVGSVEEIVASAGFSGETLPPLVALDMRRDSGAAPVLQLPVCNTLLRAAEGVATLAYTGDFVPLARTLSLEEETRQKLERIAFLEETYREPRGEGRQVLAKLRQASLTPVDQSLERLMAERLGWVTRERLTDRLRQRAQFAFDRRQYLRAFVLVYEAVVVAAVMRYGPDGDPRSREVRMAARDRLYADASRDPELVRRFKYIQAIRNAIVHGTRTDDGSVKKALHSPEELKAAFNDAIKLVDDLAGQRSGSNEAPSRAAGL